MKRRVSIIELLALPSDGITDAFYRIVLTKQFASIMPQATSVWCKQAGHPVTYGTFYGLGDPLKSLDPDADIVFISCYTPVSPLAYALAKILRAQGIEVVIAGPHAKAYPKDALRFADYVVKDCDKSIIHDLAAGRVPRGSILNSKNKLDDIPLVEERITEIKTASLFFSWFNLIRMATPMLSSIGCPYSCNFCVDWNSTYRVFDSDRLKLDLNYIGQNFPKAVVTFHDPNFGIKFDATMEVLKSRTVQIPYAMESSLSVLRTPARMKSLADTNCVLVAPGIESWDDYSNKSSGSGHSGYEKVGAIANQFAELHEYVSYTQANFIFGLDTDAGDTPIQLHKLFMDKAPFVWPTLNIPVPFGGTPLFDEHLTADRIREQMPFEFYYAPYLVTTIRNYDPIAYYDKLIVYLEYCCSHTMLQRRLATRRHPTERIIDHARTRSMWPEIKNYRAIKHRLSVDRELRNYHEGKTQKLPEYYLTRRGVRLGRYASVLTNADQIPVLV